MTMGFVARTETFIFYKTKDLRTLSLATCMCEAAVLTQTHTGSSQVKVRVVNL